MKVLVVGGGGREHALVWKIVQSPRVEAVYCAPGNAGIARHARCIPISAEDIQGLLDFAWGERIDLTVVGPEAPLVAGLVDTFEEAGLKVFGPRENAAEIEGSKALAKEIMEKYGIPTARYATFTGPAAARDYIRQHGAPCVVKADGLAAGKGVTVAMTVDEALAAVETIMEDLAFGAAGERVVIEEYLEGEEVSVLAFTDGETVVPMASAQDHKRVFDGDQGPNTGGMGAYSPAPVYTDQLHEQVIREILVPTVRGMAAEGRPYRGVLYAGLMVTKDGPKVLEYNARFGDPETQPILMRLETDLVEIIESILAGRLAGQPVRWKDEAAVCVVLASGGYPGDYQKGKVITGLDQVPAGVEVFHAGTALKDGQVVTAGGRVLGVTALGATIREAINTAYEAIKPIHFEGMHYRTDIGGKALER
ncbi:phosphoribosylamine--glycine ligase [Clostridiales bacterium PH28_bin88]|nr:phosphoribosylamine--glycine ligase [Clostridiales bacterium PH28_bin88]